MRYRSEYKSQISFPLGGIGTGCIGLAGNGRLIDFEIFNRPNKKSINGYSGFAVKAEENGMVRDVRVLNGDFPEPYMGERYQGTGKNSGYGFGPLDCTLAGLPHFADNDFIGEFPVAEVEFFDSKFPGRVRMTAFNPFIPLDADNSGIPAAFFEIGFKNGTDHSISYSAVFFMGNPFAQGISVNRQAELGKGSGVTLSCSEGSVECWQQGDLTIATGCPDAACQEYWYRGAWRDNIEMFWNDFGQPGMLKNRSYQTPEKRRGINGDTACVESRIELRPGEEGKIRFILSWNFPNRYNDWNEEPNRRTIWKNYYATKFSSSEATARYGLLNWDFLYEKTDLFRKTLYGSTLPGRLIEAVGANLSVLKTPTVLRLEDGTFYGFEGCLETEGSCEGSCTHVWNYAYALPFLFPELERSMRKADFTYNQREDGRMSFRLMLPLGRERQDFNACVDGQMGGIIKTYRDWRICGDDEWLRAMWPAVKKSLEYAWAESNEDRWDPEQKGVIEGRQHHTLDMELFGPNSWLTGFYLAALDAASRMAEYLGETQDAEHYRSIRQQGMKWVDENLFFDDHFGQKIDLGDRSILEPYCDEKSMVEMNVADAYWNQEKKELKYQIGKGCHVDQVLAGWHCNLCKLNPVFDRKKERAALATLYERNFRKMREQTNIWRNFALNEEEGLVVCTWKDGERPTVPLTYSTECMTGFEYQAACHMIQDGLIDQGLRIVSAIRDRYDGRKRNPWNEIECGSNYARSMASYSLLPAVSGFFYDAVEKKVTIEPAIGENFRCFFCTGSCWGMLHKTTDAFELEVLSGIMKLNCLELEKKKLVQEVTVNGRRVQGEIDGNRILMPMIVIGEKEMMRVSF